MRELATERLILRAFTPEDFESVHSYTSDAEITKYMVWGPNSPEDTKRFIKNAIDLSEENPVKNYQYAAVLKESGRLIGACNLCIPYGGDEGEVGWILHKDFWRMGYGSEMGKAMLELGFDSLNLRRIFACCDSENQGSYKVMEKLGMHKVGLFIEARKAFKGSCNEYSDELLYAILKADWEAFKEMNYYCSLPVEFTDFIEVLPLNDGEIYLVCKEKKKAVPEKNYVPDYDFHICCKGEAVGGIDLRIGYTKGLYYGGQIGYNVSEAHRGKGYAVRACRLPKPVAKAHGVKKLLITNNFTNLSSRRVCEKLGAKLLRETRIPEWHNLYEEGQRRLNIFEWSI